MNNASSLGDGSAAVASSSSLLYDDNDRQLRKPKVVAEKEPQLDFAVVGFEKTGMFLMCD